MLRIIEDKNLCEKRNVDGMYLLGLEEIIVADRNDKAVLCHEISHYLYDVRPTEYLDSIINISRLLGVDFWDIVNVQEVSEMVDDYEIMLDEIMAYFMEQVYKDFPEVILDSIPIYRNILERGD